MSNLVERLRTEVNIGSGTVTPLRLAAADEIDRLKSLLVRYMGDVVTNEGVSFTESWNREHVTDAEAQEMDALYDAWIDSLRSDDTKEPTDER